MTDLALSCRCGKLQGTISDVEHRSGERARCYCRDCQSYAHHLGTAEYILDEHGGTGMYLTTPRGLSFQHGAEQLACLQLSPKGPLRWYAQCCNTPIANVISNPKMPFASVPLAAIPGDIPAALGTRETGILARDAHGTPINAQTHDGMSPAAGLRAVLRVLRGRLLGHHRDSPFFKADGTPVAPPRILSREERAAALALAGFPVMQA